MKGVLLALLGFIIVCLGCLQFKDTSTCLFLVSIGVGLALLGERVIDYED